MRDSNAKSQELTSSYKWRCSKNCATVTRTATNLSSSSEQEEEFKVGTPVYVLVSGKPEPAIIISINKLPEKSQVKSKGEGRKKKRRKIQNEVEEAEEEEEEQGDDADPNDSPFSIKIRYFAWPQTILDEFQRAAMLIRDNEIYYAQKAPPRTGLNSTPSRRRNDTLRIEEEFNMQYVIRSFTLHSSPEACASALDPLPEEHRSVKFDGEDLCFHLFITYAIDPSIRVMWKCDWDEIYERGMSQGLWSMMEKDPKTDALRPLSVYGLTPQAFSLTVPAPDYEIQRAGKGSRGSLSKGQSPNPKSRSKSKSKPTSNSNKGKQAKKMKPPRAKKSRIEADEDGDEDESSGEEADQSDYSDQEDAESSSEQEVESESGSEPETESDEEAPLTPSKRRHGGYSTSTPSKRRAGASSAMSTPRSAASSLFTPRSASRKEVLDQYTSLPSLPARPPKLSSFSAQELKTLSPVERAKRLLHVGATPDQLVCREAEYYEIFNQVQGAVNEGSGSCVYVSGVPGTGKTATVRAVVRSLNRSAQLGEMEPFTFVEINGMKLPDANQSYSLLWSAISGGQRAAPKQALSNLTSHFGKLGSRGAPMGVNRGSTVVLMDEMDQLVTGRQDVMYNLFNWPNTHGSKLIIIAVANTFDLPERHLSPKVLSRLGMHRIPFYPYDSRQLELIVQSRLGFEKQNAISEEQEQEKEREIGEIDKAAIQGCAELFHVQAIQLAAKKVANVSGDARRMLDSCRRALEMVEERAVSSGMTIKPVTPVDVTEVFKNIVKSGKAAHIHALPFQAKILLGAILKVFQSQGKPEIEIADILIQHAAFCKSNQFRRSRFVAKEEGGTAVEMKKVVEFSKEEMMRLLARLTSLGLIVPVGVGCGPARAGGLARIMLACEEADFRLAMGGGQEKADSDPRLRKLF